MALPRASVSLSRMLFTPARRPARACHMCRWTTHATRRAPPPHRQPLARLSKVAACQAIAPCWSIQQATGAPCVSGRTARAVCPTTGRAMSCRRVPRAMPRPCLLRRHPAFNHHSYRQPLPPPRRHHKLHQPHRQCRPRHPRRLSRLVHHHHRLAHLAHLRRRHNHHGFHRRHLALQGAHQRCLHRHQHCQSHAGSSSQPTTNRRASDCSSTGAWHYRLRGRSQLHPRATESSSAAAGACCFCCSCAYSAYSVGVAVNAADRPSSTGWTTRPPSSSSPTSSTAA